MAKISLLDEDGAAAVISGCGRYRYWLWRGARPRVLWVMLNPSTADAATDDPTIRKLRGFSPLLSGGAGGFEVVNLFGLRSTDPRGLLAADDPIGRENQRLIEMAVAAAQENGTRIVVAWGNIDRRVRKLAEPAIERLRALPGVSCLGRTRSGDPRHPLMLPYATDVESWP